MREIKFRVWDKAIPKHDGELDNPTGQLVPWDYVKDSDYLKDGLNGLYPIMQYTGLKDKNGVEIYEGDIWRKGTYPYNVITVAFERGAFNVATYSTEKGRVLGNIHQHPELLEN